MDDKKASKERFQMPKLRLDAFFILLLVFSAGTLSSQSGQIQEYIGTFQDSFDTIQYKDPESSVDHWGDGYISLNAYTALGGSLPTLSLPQWVDTVCAGDFDSDGLTDLIVTGSRYCNVLAFIRNNGRRIELSMTKVEEWLDGCQGGTSNPLTGVQGEPIDPAGYVGLTSGDYDGDGDVDFFFVCADSGGSCVFKRVWLYKNRINETGSLDFERIDLTASHGYKLGGIAWSSTMMDSADIGGDGDIDILFGNCDGQVMQMTNLGTETLSSETFSVVPLPLIETGWGGRGVSTVTVFDGNGDGHPDILLGSVSTPDLRYYLNDELDNFNLLYTYSDPDGDTLDNDYDGAAAVTLAADFDRDGDVDFVVGTDNWNYHTAETDNFGGRGYFFENREGVFTSQICMMPLGQLDHPGDDREGLIVDVDTGAVFDIDGDGFPDFLFEDQSIHSNNDGSESETMTGHMFYRAVSPRFALYGIGQSLVVSGAIEGQKLITRARIKTLTQDVLGPKADGMILRYYLSNDGGNTWEFYKEYRNANIADDNNLPYIKFKTFGSQLMFKAVFYASNEGNLSGSSESPVIHDIELEYAYIDQREFSRSSPVHVSFENDEGKTVNLLLAASFIYPSWDGHLRAYDVTNMSFEGDGYSLRTLSTSNLDVSSGRSIVPEGTLIAWDAGEWLKYRTAASRNIYTALPLGTDGALVRADFFDGNAAALQPYLKDPDHKDASLINFVRGEARDWKLGWIDHSTPKVVGPPTGISSQKGPGYSTFMESLSDRRTVVYAGANDGMLHCFDVLTGEELWGFIPFNLLSRLRELSSEDRLTGNRILNKAAEVFVDSTPAVEDVYIDRDGDGKKEWITILICGQGKAKGYSAEGGKYHYFALDVTNPENPIPIWEFGPGEIGETWSVPEIGRVKRGGLDFWAAVMGSGYNARTPYFYILDAASGVIVQSFDAGGVNTQPTLGASIKNALPGSPGTIDIKRQGTLDRVYYGDLNGRLWKIDLSALTWTAEIIYTDSLNAPIITKPEVWVDRVLGETSPHIAFGTGGDDAAPADNYYSFVTVRDSQTAYVEWYIGDFNTLGIGGNAKDMGDLDPGEKIWADPVVSDGLIYFSTFKGNIEEVDPLASVIEPGRLYVRYVRASMGTPGSNAVYNTLGYYALASKTRAAVTKGSLLRNSDDSWQREVFIQEFDSTLQTLTLGDGSKIEPPEGFGKGSALKVRAWREVMQILR
jgi:hypothetical protein